MGEIVTDAIKQFEETEIITAVIIAIIFSKNGKFLVLIVSQLCVCYEHFNLCQY